MFHKKMNKNYTPRDFHGIIKLFPSYVNILMFKLFGAFNCVVSTFLITNTFHKIFLFIDSGYCN